MNLSIVVALVLVLVVLAAYWAWPRAHAAASGMSGGRSLKGWTLFVLPGCPHCTEQEAALERGGFTGYRKIVCGAAPPAACAAAPAFPFWRHRAPDEKRVGFQNIAQLAAMAH